MILRFSTKRLLTSTYCGQCMPTEVHACWQTLFVSLHLLRITTLLPLRGKNPSKLGDARQVENIRLKVTVWPILTNFAIHFELGQDDNGWMCAHPWAFRAST